MRHVISLMHMSAFSPADLAMLGDLLLVAFATAALAYLLRMIWRLLHAVVQQMAQMVSWTLAIVTILFLVIRLVRFFA